MKAVPDCLFTWDGPRGERLTRLLFRRVDEQIKMALGNDAIRDEVVEAVGRHSTKLATEGAVESVLSEHFGNRLLYGTVRRLAERFRG